MRNHSVASTLSIVNPICMYVCMYVCVCVCAADHHEDPMWSALHEKLFVDHRNDADHEDERDETYSI